MNITERRKMLYRFLKEENEPTKKQFHGFLSKDDMDREYEELMNQKKLKVKSGIINLTSEGWKLYILAENDDFLNGFKVGQLEQSYIEGFQSFVEEKPQISKVSFKFSIKEPESPGSEIRQENYYYLHIISVLFLIFIMCCLS
jgi:hypothetical protein